MAVLDAYTDNPGTWLFHCHLTDHIAGGMMSLFHVAGKAPEFKSNGKVSGGTAAASSIERTCGGDCSAASPPPAWSLPAL
jgi:hypothetical protein